MMKILLNKTAKRIVELKTIGQIVNESKNSMNPEMIRNRKRYIYPYSCRIVRIASRFFIQYPK